MEYAERITAAYVRNLAGKGIVISNTSTDETQKRVMELEDLKENRIRKYDPENGREAAMIKQELSEYRNYIERLGEAV